MIAYIIFNNDSPEAVVLDNQDKAIEELERLAGKHSSDLYSVAYYWHIHEVEVVGGVK